MSFFRNLFSSKRDHSEFEKEEAKTDKYSQEYPGISIDEVQMPSIGRVQTSKVRKWYKEEGDPVATGDVLCEIDAGNALLELESYSDGYISSLQQQDKPIRPGGVICLISKEKLNKN